MNTARHFAVFSTAAVLAIAGVRPVWAANWFALQNTEPAHAKPLRVWGFIQPTYEASFADKVQGAANPAFNGQRPVFNLIAPDQESSSSFELKRARLGVRGTMPKTNGMVDYFVLAEFAHNGITKHASAVELTDASATLNYIPGARIRVGQFKYPGPEEGFQAFPLVDPFIEFTTVTNQLIMGRSFRLPAGGTSTAAGITKVQANGGVDAFRDIGAEVFDWRDWGPWEAAYGVMISNGSTINAQDDNSNKQWSARLQGSYVFGGKGAYRQDLTTWVWYQAGKRTLGGTDYNRRREGVGAILNYKPFRVSAAYLRGTGMIFTGINPPFNIDAIASSPTVAAGSQNKARGWYMEGEYTLPELLDIPQFKQTAIELRYDAYDRLPNDPAAERRFHTWTVGVQYSFTPTVKLRVNYLVQSLKVGNAALLPAAQQQNAEAITASMGNMLGAQVLVWF